MLRYRGRIPQVTSLYARLEAAKADECKDGDSDMGEEGGTREVQASEQWM